MADSARHDVERQVRHSKRFDYFRAAPSTASSRSISVRAGASDFSGGVEITESPGVACLSLHLMPLGKQPFNESQCQRREKTWMAVLPLMDVTIGRGAGLAGPFVMAGGAACVETLILCNGRIFTLAGAPAIHDMRCNSGRSCGWCAFVRCRYSNGRLPSRNG
jgi:hypothetical protein